MLIACVAKFDVTDNLKKMRTKQDRSPEVGKKEYGRVPMDTNTDKGTPPLHDLQPARAQTEQRGSLNWSHRARLSLFTESISYLSVI